MARPERIYKDIFPAVSVPLKPDFTPDEKQYVPYLEWLAGFDEIRGVVANGHTGEIVTWSTEERAAITKMTADAVGDRKLIVSGVQAEGTIPAIKEAQAAEKAGADAILLMPPHNWLRFGMHRDAPYAYFSEIAKNISIDIIVHLYPFGTKAFYPIETRLKLAEIPNVKCVKDGTRQMAVYEQGVRIMREKAPDITIITCMDEYLMTSMFPRVDGALIGFGSCIPDLICPAWKAMKAEDMKLARQYADRIFPMAEAIYGIGQPSGEAHARLKEALRQRGHFDNALMREPVLPLDEKEIQQVANAIKAAGLSKVK